jgi:hypothetical protein
MRTCLSCRAALREFRAMPERVASVVPPAALVATDGVGRLQTLGGCRNSGCESGTIPDVGGRARADTPPMPRFVLHHEHAPRECRAVFAAWQGHESPLRHRVTVASCVFGGHAIWWTVEARSEEEALALLPFYVAERATATPVREVEIP